MIKKNAVLISGGGSWGAYGGGTLAKINNDYDTVIGISTGALMSPFVALKEWEFLKLGYSSIGINEIFDKVWYKPLPITKKGKINKLATILTLILGEKSIATSNNLRKKIDTFFPEDFFNELYKNKKEVLIGTQNYAQIPSKIHYFSNLDENYEDFKDWMWCSANFPYITSLVRKIWYDRDGNYHIGLWGDGGLLNLVGFDKLGNDRYENIDIILHRTKIENKYEGNVINDLTDNVITSINAMRYHIEFNFFYRKIEELVSKGTTVNVYWLPRKLNSNSMFFDKKMMLDWWNEGYETAFDLNRRETFKPV